MLLFALYCLFKSIESLSFDKNGETDLVGRFFKFANFLCPPRLRIEPETSRTATVRHSATGALSSESSRGRPKGNSRTFC